MKNLNKVIVFFCLLLSINNVKAQIEPPKNNSEKLKGNVKSVSIIQYSAVEYFGELKKDTLEKNTEINYDTNNNPLNWKKISKRKGEETGEIFYTDTNNSKERKRIRDKNEIDLFQWKYDNRGNIIEYNRKKSIANIYYI